MQIIYCRLLDRGAELLMYFLGQLCEYSESSGHDERQQVENDCIGLFALSGGIRDTCHYLIS